jgi:serine/threonine protein kinase HipA of HipAB toxin-antitoxin module
LTVRPELWAVEHAEAGHVLVKFSPDAASADAQRWRDLLHAEHEALSLLAGLGLPAAATAAYSLGQRIFLESRRFDRRGARGRVPALSLAALDAEYVGEGYGWTRVSRRLHDDGLLDNASLERIAWLESFGAWIGNTDMHLGNVSLAPTDNGFSLLPVYDMVPMAFAPVRGELPAVQLPPPIRTANNEAVWAAAGHAASTLWLRLADDARLSDSFRGIAQGHGRRWRELL